MQPINRKLLKENGKIALKHNFWVIMLVVFVGTFLGANWNGIATGGGGINFGSYNFGNMSTYNNSDFTGTIDEASSVEAAYEMLEDMINDVTSSDFDYSYDSSLSNEQNSRAFLEELLDHFNLDEEKFLQGFFYAVGIILIIGLLISIIATCIQFVIGSFLYAPIGVGMRRFFMLNRRQEAKFTDIFSSFAKGKYMKIVKAMFQTNIRIWGWSLLFYFPGLVKFYQYYFVPFIMAENPDISPERAREISKKMSDGHKWQIFVLELSFLGWVMVFVFEEILLALISCGLLAIPGVVLIYPLVGYENVTFAELYAERREYALMTGIVRENELIGFMTVNQEETMPA